MNLTVLSANGKEVGQLAAADAVWDAPMNAALLHQAVVAQQAAQRQGTHSTKSRGEKNYSTRKLRQQKRSGRARLGSRGSPAMVGGGVAHGPQPRSYRQALPKKMRRQALRVALSSKVRDNSAKILDELSLGEVKVKPLAELVAKLGQGRSVMIVTGEHDPNVARSSRNIPRLSVIAAEQLNPLQALKAGTLLITRAAVGRIDSLWDPAQAADKAAEPAKEEAVK